MTKRRSEMTEDQRLRARKCNRLRRNYRYRHEPEYRANVLKKKEAWAARKRKRLPEYIELERLRSKACRLRGQIERHQAELEAEERELVKTVRRISVLAEKCREPEQGKNLKGEGQ